MANLFKSLISRSDDDEELDLEFDINSPESDCFELPPDRRDNQVLAVWGSPSSGKTIMSVKLARYMAGQPARQYTRRGSCRWKSYQAERDPSQEKRISHHACYAQGRERVLVCSVYRNTGAGADRRAAENVRIYYHRLHQQHYQRCAFGGGAYRVRRGFEIGFV